MGDFVKVIFHFPEFYDETDFESFQTVCNGGKSNGCQANGGEVEVYSATAVENTFVI